MELYDIIDAINHHIKNGILILHRSMKVHPKFKVYKRFCYDLYYVQKEEKTLLFSFEELRNTISEEINNTWTDCDKLYLRELIKWIAGEDYKSIVKDEI